ncbi:kinase-like protein, partial [Armillaria gallica]
IANAMEFMHSLDPQVIHGDIRGCNILVTEHNRCCLADFGASIITSTMAPSTASMSHYSTPWMAPEFLEYSSKLYDQSFLTARDVYAFGFTIVEIFTLRTPFSHIHRSAIVNAKLEGAPYPRPSPEEFPSSKLWSLVEECVVKDPTRRPNAKSIKQRLYDA